MIDTTTKVETKWEPNPVDRCDTGCSAQAYVKVVGITGELMFCSHHFNKIMNTESGKQKMESFAFETIDGRDKLIENRLVED